jgi:subtilisin family serine protease
MCHKIVFLLFFCFIFDTLCVSFSHRIQENSFDDSLCKVWVYFTDKPDGNAIVSKKALERRSKNQYSPDQSDLPVSQKYIQSIENCDARLSLVYKWDNAASFRIASKNIKKVTLLPFVRYVRSVRSGICSEPVNKPNQLEKDGHTHDKFYGQSFKQLDFLKVPDAHDYLTKLYSQHEPGRGILIGFFDSGFRLNHKCYDHLRSGHLKATYDFVDKDTSVGDPDSVVNNEFHPYFQNDNHGSQTLSLVAGYDPGNFVGVAWGADFVLARTENTYTDPLTGQGTEIHGEEDNWAAAIVWAESLGVDIVSSSLGYRYGFQDSVKIYRGDSVITIGSYEYEDMNGQTTIVSNAASHAARRGMLIVTSMGNGGAYESGTLSAPADVKGVISVGAVHLDENIASFSSSGPTSDGRTKPDCVAPGARVCVPVIYGGDDSTYSAFANGTSFSAPLVAGICALIMQSHHTTKAIVVKDQLFRFCRFSKYQNRIDNIYGRGIPDVYLSCSNKLALRPQYVFTKLINTFPAKKGCTSVTVNYVNALNQLVYAQKATCRIFSIDGSLIWNKTNKFNTWEPVSFNWDYKKSDGSLVAPGIYCAALIIHE